MDWIYLFTSFEGRINRKPFWLGTVICVIATFVLQFRLDDTISYFMSGNNKFPDNSVERLLAEQRSDAILAFVIVAITFYPSTALMKKRLNDRDRPNWLLFFFWAPVFVEPLINFLGLGYVPREVGGVLVPFPSPFSMWNFAAMFGIGVWCIIETGFLRGTNGPNKHGPDPLAS